MEEKIQQPAENINDGDKPETASIIDRADSIVKRMVEAEEIVKKMDAVNQKTEELLRRQEEIFARNLLSGRAEAGFKNVELSPEEKRKKEINELLKDTGLKI